MNWQTELTQSITWIIYAFVWIVGGLFAMTAVLSRMKIGKEFWCLSVPCFQQSHKWKSIGLIALLLIFVLLEVRISVLNTFFYNGLYSALGDKNVNAFWFFASINAGLVVFKIIHSILNYLLRQTFEIHWLAKLNQIMLARWLQNKNYYRIKYEKNLPDNIDQRIEQDAREFITGTVDLFEGILSAIVSIVEFTAILATLSGVFVLMGFPLPDMVFYIYAFIILATSISVLIGHPLVKMNFDKERLSGDYRYLLIRVRDNAESIAFYSGEQNEWQNLSQKFNAIIQNRWLIVRQILGLEGFNTGVTQVAMILPLMLQAPRFFAGQASLGDMHQTVQAFNRLMRALSFFRLFYEQFTLYQARLSRLYGFMTNLDYLDHHQIPQVVECGYEVSLKNFGIKDQQGEILFQNMNLHLKQGDALLIQGPSGSGKTTLLKAIAGIYPFEIMGYAERPCDEHILFLPQRPYMPQGSLRDAICYPNMTLTQSELEAVMRQCRLEKYLYALDQHNDWQAILSPGELQRVAFVRIFLSQPNVVFLDETTSALDEPTEYHLYNAMRMRLPNTIVISVGHRCTLSQFHNQQLDLGSCQIKQCH
ncbi:MAG: ABC transporter ATP-binding protein/permease [Pasteurellaceae bacterium]|nr:ABC transporter ATP-binding protein/permease [Pasteurellaceae bacterium]